MKESLKNLLLVATAGGLVQIGGEAGVVISGSNSLKFPQGWQSFCLPEEALEGGLMALPGAIMGGLIYRLLCERGEINYSRPQEKRWMLFGATTSYCGLAYLVGPFIHHLNGIADIKWGPFR
jgi:hypothetical protein